MINIDQIKQLRAETGISISECKKALEESKGDFNKSKEILRKWGKELAGQKSNRKAGLGIIETYVHPDKRIGSMIELRCETDFVAKSKDFKELAHEICLQVAATDPLFLEEENIPEKFLNEEKEIYKEQLKNSGKPPEIMENILEGKLKKYKEGVSLMSQPWVKDQEKTIKDLVDLYISKLGENIMVKNFIKYEI
jgi:elongation factor Ts